LVHPLHDVMQALQYSSLLKQIKRNSEGNATSTK